MRMTLLGILLALAFIGCGLSSPLYLKPAQESEKKAEDPIRREVQEEEERQRLEAQEEEERQRLEAQEEQEEEERQRLNALRAEIMWEAGEAERRSRKAKANFRGSSYGSYTGYKKCTKGCPCGHTCISCEKECHIQ